MYHLISNVHSWNNNFYILQQGFLTRYHNCVDFQLNIAFFQLQFSTSFHLHAFDSNAVVIQACDCVVPPPPPSMEGIGNLRGEVGVLMPKKKKEMYEAKLKFPQGSSEYGCSLELRIVLSGINVSK